MKFKIKRVATVFIALVMMLTIGDSIIIYAKENLLNENMDIVNVIYEYVDAVNTNNTEKYGSLFVQDVKNDIEDALKKDKNNFFYEESEEIRNIKKINNILGSEITNIKTQEFEDIAFYYTEEKIQYKQNQLENILCDDENMYRIYVIVKEYGKWKIYRILTADLNKIINNDLQFNTDEEQSAYMKQKNLIQMFSLVGDGTYSDIVAPNTTTVYFTKSANINAYNSVRATINFNSYVRDVIPNEWTVSYYGSYPEYLKAGALASKMYAWYYTVYPKWDYAPFYACMKDNTSDQQYLYNSCNNLASQGSQYVGYVDSVMSFISDKAMVVRDTASLFEVHYHATNGSQYSGELSASGCLSLAKNGYNYGYILHYYYNYSTYTNGNEMYIVTGSDN